MMQCDHLRWVYPPPVENDWTGEMEDQPAYQVSTNEDLDTGRFRCTRCGEIGYYTGLWKAFYEKGIPCSGSDRIKVARR